MVYTILSLDPGGSTGWATLQAEVVPDLDTGAPQLLEPKFACGQIEDPDHHSRLFALLEMNHTQYYTVVCESFEYRNQSRAGLELVSKEYIGVVKLFMQERNLGEAHFQTASQGKVRNKNTAFVKPRNLQRLGLWTSGYPHAMDGYGHLLYYICHSKDATLAPLRHGLLEKGWRG